MDLQEAIKKSIQTYMDGEDVLPEGRKYTKTYLDNFHTAQSSPDVKSKGDKKVAKELKKVDNAESD